MTKEEQQQLKEYKQGIKEQCGVIKDQTSKSVEKKGVLGTILTFAGGLALSILLGKND